MDGEPSLTRPGGPVDRKHPRIHPERGQLRVWASWRGISSANPSSSPCKASSSEVTASPRDMRTHAHTTPGKSKNATTDACVSSPLRRGDGFVKIPPMLLTGNDLVARRRAALNLRAPLCSSKESSGSRRNLTPDHQNSSSNWTSRLRRTLRKVLPPSGTAPFGLPPLAFGVAGAAEDACGSPKKGSVARALRVR